MEPATRLDHNHQLSLKELPYIVRWKDHRCTRCGRCTAVCPVKAIEPSVKVKRTVYSEGPLPEPQATRKIVQVVEQVTDIERYCTGCGTCTLVCPNDAIEPEYNPQNKFLHYKNKGGEGYKRGGRRNDPSISTLDRLKFTRISMLTDPALDAGRHEFRVRTLLGRILPADELPLKNVNGTLMPDDNSDNSFRRSGKSSRS
ncbi:MAG: 4Fe-4S dicluster domain-containing protein [Thermodesulfovibrionales bacterium]|jgi:glutamate synthase (NADPH/NADH) large chain